MYAIILNIVVCLFCYVFVLIFRDIMMIAISGGLTSIFSGFVIFSVIGFMAWDSQLPVEEVVASGKTLTRGWEVQKKSQQMFHHVVIVNITSFFFLSKSSLCYRERKKGWFPSWYHPIMTCKTKYDWWCTSVVNMLSGLSVKLINTAYLHNHCADQLIM